MFSNQTSSPFKAPSTTTAAPSFSFGGGGSTSGSLSTLPSFGLGLTTSTPAFSFPSVTTPASSTQSSFGFGTQTTKSAFGTGLSLAASSNVTASAPASTSFLGQALSSTSVGSAVSTSASSDSQKQASLSAGIASNKEITFAELADFINKWSWEIHDLEKQTMNDVEQLKEWDSVLNSNADKIVELHKSFDEQKQKQQELEHTLDYVGGQQQELEENLTSLENAILGDASADVQFNNTYTEAQVIDSKLQKMREDLNDIVRSANRRIPLEETEDPLGCIVKVLRLFHSSLESIEESIHELQKRLNECKKASDAYRSIAAKK